jgi:hypothetical protein
MEPWWVSTSGPVVADYHCFEKELDLDSDSDSDSS